MVWTLYLDEALSFDGSQAVGDNLLSLEGLRGNQLLIQVSSPSAAPRWRLAFRLIFIQPLLDFPGGAIVAESYGRKVLLGRSCLIEAPLSIVSPYGIKLMIPYWHRQLNLKIWEREQTWE